MDRSDVINLIGIEWRNDDNGVPRPVQTESRTVMCQVDSVSRNEFFEGGRNGLNPELVFRVFFADYNQESELEYKGDRYAVYRTYRGRGDLVELYAERKGGTNGGH